MVATWATRWGEKELFWDLTITTKFTRQTAMICDENSMQAAVSANRLLRLCISPDFCLIICLIDSIQMHGMLTLQFVLKLCTLFI